MVPKCIGIGLIISGNLEIFGQCISPVYGVFCLRKRCIILLSIVLYSLDAIAKKRLYLLPFLLIEHWHIGLATPAIKRFCHGRLSVFSPGSPGTA